MDMRKVSEKFFVGPQITPEDIDALKSAGIKAIICNRPDGEGPDQPTFSEIEAAAKAAGLEARYVPRGIRPCRR